MRSVSVLCVSRRHYSAVLKAARRRGPNSALIVVAVTVDRAGGDGVVGHDVLVSLASRRADRSTDKLVDARSPSVSNLYCQRLGEPGVFQGYRAEAL